MVQKMMHHRLDFNINKQHCKKKGTFWNLKKRFGGLQKVCKCVESSKKRIKNNSEPLKDLTVCPGEDPFFFDTFLSFVDQKKGFVGKNETYKVSYLIQWFYRKPSTKPRGSIRNSKGFIFTYKTLFLVYET